MKKILCILLVCILIFSGSGISAIENEKSETKNNKPQNNVEKLSTDFNEIKKKLSKMNVKDDIDKYMAALLKQGLSKSQQISIEQILQYKYQSMRYKQ